MNRRNFIKILAGLPLIGSLPVLAKQKSMVFDGCDSYLKADTFALNEPHTVYTLHKRVPFDPKDLPNLTMWQGFETDERGVTRYIDKLTGEDLSDNIKGFNGDDYQVISGVFDGKKSVLVDHNEFIGRNLFAGNSDG